jgi:arylsulfatase A-like enzyme
VTNAAPPHRTLAALLEAALLAGLFEGGLIAGHLLLAGEGPPRGPLDLLADVAPPVGLHLLAWLVLGLVLWPFARQPFSLFRAVLTVWAVAAFAARRLLEAESGPGAHVLLVVVLAALWLPPARWRQRLRPLYRVALAGGAVLLVSLYSLWGRAPDFRYDLAVIGGMYLASAALAAFAVLALFRWPRATTAALVVLVGAALVGGHLGQAAPADRPSVLFVLVDTLRRDHVSPFRDLVRTPAAERLASRGILFSDAVTVIPKTAQSVASILTARYPIRHGLRGLYDHLSPDQPNLARAFQRAGYSTVAVVNNPWISPNHGFDHGFDRFYGTDEIRDDFGGSARFVAWSVLYDRWIRRPREWRPPQPEGFFEARASDLTEAAVQVLRHEREPFFLYVHYFQPHWPYMPPPPLQERYDAPSPETSVVNNIEKSEYSRGQMIFHNPLPESENEGARRLYEGEVDDTLAEMGRLLDSLRGSPYARSTIVVFIADHGHALGEHGYFFHHGAFLYDVSIRIPLILSWPGHLPEGRVVEQQVRSVDVGPTLLELAGVPLEASVDGRSLSGYWTGAEDASREALLESDVRMMDANKRREVGGVLGKLRAWRSDRYKLILTPAIRGPRFELFDLVTDPEEAHDLSGEVELRPVFEQMREKLVAALPERERRALGPIDLEGQAGDEAAPGVSESELELLRQLGYVE